MNQLVSRVILPGLILVVAVACAGFLVLSSPDAERAPPEPDVARVDIAVAEPVDVPARVHATGTVQPSRQVTVTPEVGGRLVAQSPELVPGGRFREGELVARVDPRDYELAVEQQQAQLQQAELELELELGRQETAQREWALLGDDRPLETAGLALRKPHLVAAEQNVQSARASLEQARLALARTRLVAPFDAVVLDESAEVGQLVSAGTPLATLAGTEAFWVRVSVPVDQLDAVAIPGVNAEAGSRAVVRQRVGGGEARFEGEVLRLVGSLDEQTRTATLLVGVPDPLTPREQGMPLLPGAFVDVEIAGRTLSGVVPVPRAALDGDRAVWVVGEGDVLRRRPVDVGWRGPETVYVTRGIEAGDRVVVSALSLPIDGMPVEIRGAAGDDDGR